MATATHCSPPATWTNVRYCASCLAVYRTDFDRCPLDGGELEVTPTDPLIGKVVGAYVLDELIGEGGMGRVYRAHHQDHPSECVALKVLIGDLAASTLMRQRFAREAEAASQLSHKNIVGVLDFGHTVSGLPYLVMDLVEGTTLAAELHRGPIPPERAIKIARQLCEGLDHAHSRGVIHRDFKPDNILVVGSGNSEVWRIADFGLALSTSNDTRLTTTGVACTPAYAAPEQLRGGTIDSRVDLYALGTTLFEMLTGGMLPFDGDMQGTIRMKLQGEAPSLTLIVPEVTPALSTLVARLLEYSPERRPRSARSLIVALDTALRAPKHMIRSTELAPRSKSGHMVTFPAPNTIVDRRRRDKGRIAALAAAAIMCAVAIGALIRSSSPAFRPTVARAPEPLVAGLPPEPVEVTPVSSSFVVPVATDAAPLLRMNAAPATATRMPSVRKVAKPVRTASGRIRKPEPRARPGVTVAAGKAARSKAQITAVPAAAPIDASREAAAIATRYGVVGSDLVELEMALGTKHVADLWPSYHRIHLSAMTTQASRDDANAILTAIEARIAERRAPVADDVLR